jgi:hypothetical protein
MFWWIPIAIGIAAVLIMYAIAEVFRTREEVRTVQILVTDATATRRPPYRVYLTVRNWSRFDARITGVYVDSISAVRISPDVVRSGETKTVVADFNTDICGSKPAVNGYVTADGSSHRFTAVCW